MAVITISRQVGSGSEQVASQVAELLGYRYFDKRLMIRVAAEVGLSENEVVDFSEEHYKAANFLGRLFGSRVVTQVATRQRDSTGAETLNVAQLDEAFCIDLIQTVIRAAYERSNIVILGRGGQAILHDLPGVFHIRLEAPMEVRALRVQSQKGFNALEAQAWVIEQDRRTAQYLKHFFEVRWDDPILYHMVINTGKIEPEMASQIIVNTVTQLQTKPVS